MAALELRWLEAPDNPFGMRVLDCRPVTRHWLSTTADLEVAGRFGALRTSDGRQHVGRHPDRSRVHECDLRYPPSKWVVEGMMFHAREMEDKWDIYLHEGHMYFARSWSGELVAVAEVGLDPVRIAWVTAADFGGPLEPSFAVREVDFLVKSHLYRKEVPHPMPLGYSDAATDVATYSMHRYGRWASFATFDDPTAFDPWASPPAG